MRMRMRMRLESRDIFYGIVIGKKVLLFKVLTVLSITHTV